MSSFLDNSGDIILDAVLTDVGRQRLARADGSFKIYAFSFGDDEINYKLYDATQSTARKDLNILRTPVLEAFTDSSVSVKYKLLTLPGQNNSLFLPVARLNTKTANSNFPGFPYAASADNPSGNGNQFVVLVNQNTVNKYVQNSSLTATTRTIPTGFINGVSSLTAASSLLVVDQGLDTNQLSYTTFLTNDLVEDSYLIQIDDRLGKIASPDGRQAVESFIDSNNIATYVLTNPAYYGEIPGGPGANLGDSPIAGPRGPRFTFSVFSSLNIASSDFLFDQFGQQVSNYFPTQAGSGSRTAKVIDSIVRVRGNKTGVSLDIPVRFTRAVE